MDERELPEELASFGNAIFDGLVKTSVETLERIESLGKRADALIERNTIDPVDDSQRENASQKAMAMAMQMLYDQCEKPPDFSLVGLCTEKC